MNSHPPEVESLSPAPVRVRADAREQRHPADRFVPLAASASPTVSWIVPLVRTGQAQTAFEIELVSADDSVWTSGVIESADPWMRVRRRFAANSSAIARVKTRDENGRWSAWSDAIPIETGPLRLADWNAQWVAHPTLHILRREFDLATSAASARLHLTAQGLVRASVNNVAVNADSSDPSRTDITRALYRTYDVTDLLRTGRNTLDLELADGEWERTGLDPRVLACVVVDTTDGTRVIAGTGPDMLTARSSVVVHEPFYLERRDLTVSDLTFRPAVELRVLTAVDDPVDPSTPPTRVDVDPAPPIRVVQTLDARPADARTHAPSWTTTASASPNASAPSPSTARLWDVGVNVAARSRVVIRSAVPAGTVVRVVHGEHIKDGRVDTTNLSMPYDHGRTRQCAEYVIPARTADASDLVLEPRFCYHGFRYVEVSGLPADTMISVQAAVLHTDLRSISDLHTDDAHVNALTATARRTLLNNVHGIPEDCPTREQSGWTGDTASVSEFEFSAFDMQTFFAKWIDDLLTSQQPSGWIPAIAPDLRAEKVPADPVWGGALQRVLWGHWLHYGDRDLVQRCLPALRRWADFQLGCRTDTGIIGNSPISYGHDWLALEQTPPELHHTAATIDTLTILAAFERERGDASAADRRDGQAGELRDAARRAFVDPETSTVGNGSQASDALALHNGWLTESQAPVVSQRMVADVRARGNRVSSGFAATRTVVRALAAAGASQAVFDVLHQTLQPGVGAMLTEGNGTFWECWWIDPTNTGTGSLDHLGLGGPFASWAWQALAGLQPISSGYARFTVEPQLVVGVDELELTTHTVRGTIRVAYRRTGDEIHLELTVPVGAEAVLRLAGTEEVVGPGQYTRRAAWPTAAAITAGDSTADDSTADDSTADDSAADNAPTTAFQAPSWARRSADVHGDGALLRRATGASSAGADAISASPASTASIRAGENTRIVTLDGNLQCMPVPHAQLHGPMVLVRGESDHTGQQSPTLKLDFSPPRNAGAAQFAYAMIDLCIGGPAQPVHTELTVTAADGSARRATGRIWPAGWNRVSVDLHGWGGRAAIVSISVAVLFDSIPAESTGPSAVMDAPTPAFHVGEMGYSTRRRTWP